MYTYNVWKKKSIEECEARISQYYYFAFHVDKTNVSYYTIKI